MKIACLMMQKNEGVMLETWARYHAHLFGSENIYIFDNGSSDSETLEILSKISSENIYVNYEHVSFSDFERKGDIFLKKVRELESSDKGYDFFIFLDCDEFIVACDDDGRVDLSFGAVQRVLSSLPRDGSAKYIRGTYLNHPTKHDLFYFKYERKSFFETGTLRSLDVGFHQGKSFNDKESSVSNIVYLHFHGRPYASLLRAARQKLSGRVNSFTYAALKQHEERRGRGHHLVRYLLSSEADIMEAYDRIQMVSVPFKACLDAIGAGYPHQKEIDEAGGHSLGRVPAVQPEGASFADVWAEAGEVRFEFGSPRGALPTAAGRGFRITARSRYSAEVGYGWVLGDDLLDRVREGAKEYGTLVLGRERAIFRVRLEPGLLGLRIVSGDLDFDDHRTLIQVPDCSAQIPIIESRLREFTTIETSVELRGQFLDIIFDSPIDNWVVNEIVISRIEALRNTQVTSKFQPFDPSAPSLWPKFAGPESEPESLLARHLAEIEGRASEPTKVTQADYLTVISGIVDFFRPLQNADGAIIDRQRDTEFQYATPYFGYCAALLVRHAGRSDLVGPAVAAIDHAVRSLVTRSAANGHEDFFSLAIAHALQLIAPDAAAEQVAAWSQDLAAMIPQAIYRCPAGGRDRPGSNWNCLAVAGEIALARQGIRKDTGFLEYSLKQQGRFFDPNVGTYKEGPTVYDIFPRVWLADAVAGGYAGPSAEALARGLDLGAVTSLFLQSPNGGLMNGGRSAHHLWADALQVGCFEFAARRAQERGRVREAGVFKRAARRALIEIMRWAQDTGQLWIVKNRGRPEHRLGYETYSSESQYNLAAGMAIALGYEVAASTEDVVEELTPSETGRHVLHLPPPIPRTVALFNGAQVVITHRTEPNQTPAGVTRIQFGGVDDRLGVQDGLVDAPGYRLLQPLRRDVSIGVQWREGNEWRSVSNLKPSEYSIAIRELPASEKGLGLELSYRLKRSELSYTETLWIGPNGCQLSWDLPSGSEFHVVWPVQCSDLRDEAVITVSGADVTVCFAGSDVARWQASHPVALSEAPVSHRNGLVRIASFECLGDRKPSLSLTIEPHAK